MTGPTVCSELKSNEVLRSAYVHVPFCRHRCGYCNFTVVAGRDDLFDDYLRAIELELHSLGSPHSVDTLFFGGGTPTHLAPEQLDRLLATVFRTFSLAPGGEFSVEANPADLTDEKTAVLVEHGVNRISLGAQSFDPSKLGFLERDHRAAEIEQSVQRVRGRIRSVGLDLIFGVPGETLDRWRQDIVQAVRLQVDHISTYGLTYERGTALWTSWRKSLVERADEELEGAMYETAIDRLAAAGYEHYEVSNFARLGHRCRHNEVYWAGREYFAVGPGAARYVHGRREVNHRSTTTYIRRVLAGQSPVAEREQLSPEDRAREALVIGLRRMSGVHAGEFRSFTGFDLTELGGPELDRFVAQGLLQWIDGRICLTRSGLLVSDSLWPHLLRV